MESKNLRTIEQILAAHKLVDYDEINPGDYVFATKYPDADHNDRWHVGFVSDVTRHNRASYVKFKDTGVITFRFAQKITRKEGAFLIMYYMMCENKSYSLNN